MREWGIGIGMGMGMGIGGKGGGGRVEGRRKRTKIKKSKCGELAPPYFKPYYKRTVIKTLWH